MPEVPVAVDRADPRPLSRQIADQLRDAAAHGVVRVGERLPSTRLLARSLLVSRTVTAAAYEQLYAEGWIVARHGAGTFVAAVPGASGAVGARDAADHPEAGAGAGVASGRAPGRCGREMVNLGVGSPWADGLLPAVWRRAWRRAADVSPDSVPVRDGDPQYREAVAEHLLRHRGLAVRGGSVLATAGTTAAAMELGAVLGHGCTVAVEEPGYQRAVAALRAAGARVVPAPVDADGIVVDALPVDVDAVYCTPAHQFPLGGRLPAARRIALVEWARRHGARIIEDDYDGELRYDVAPLPLLAAIGPDVVVQLGTTSKIISPTLGAGWMVAPPDVAEWVVRRRDSAGLRPPGAGQRVVAAMAETGDLAKHLRRVRRELAARRELVVQRLTGAALRVRGDRAGAHVTVPLPDAEAEHRLVATALDAGVRVEGLRRCFDGPPQLTGVTIGYAAPARREQLERALRIVVESL
ncbi:GntR family transcriptional regulator/MocR family aminotransferase [Haloactinopolyspora alba]|uniref:GntR family transcriptional regulator/MocR family aminotransferase n=1 Tax=Haloactinopolyspora alba TaxID=648780 RepID=A0A2P8E3L9_9ACTN|nr:PLP-dependent aminotransferase family protein [Haloactinopolyspora alba]PSL04061.1 GntR family transcriptional regulator/MocR family aminotransferase [Haloactinopolyspora alba]